jgi:hypothetical protein
MPLIVLSGIAVGVTIVVVEGAVITLMDRIAESALTRFGAFVSRRVQTSLKENKKVAPAGSPPNSHTRRLRKNIRFAYDRPGKRVVIGPTRLPGTAGTAPGALEAGGQTFMAVRGATQTATVARHPFMAPALRAESPHLPALFR